MLVAVGFGAFRELVTVAVPPLRSATTAPTTPPTPPLTRTRARAPATSAHASRLRLCGGRTGVRPLQRCGDLVVAAARAVRTAGATRVGCAVRGALLVRGLMGTVRVAESLRGLLLLRLPEGFGGPAFSGSGFGGSGERFGRLVTAAEAPAPEAAAAAREAVPEVPSAVPEVLSAAPGWWARCWAARAGSARRYGPRSSARFRLR